jgi:amidohydrolase
MNMMGSVAVEATWQTAIDTEVDHAFEQMVEVRRHLHSHPDPSGHEQPTTEYLREKLVAAGFQLRFGPERRGLIIDSATQHDWRVGLRADIDALRIHDAKQVGYRSRRDGLMHACGHDGHTATLFGATLALARAQAADALPPRVSWRAIFQPAEETSRGAHEMIDAGALEHLNAILSLHMDPSRPVGTIGVRDGALTASCDEVEIHVRGRGGHAARPHESIDPIAAAAQLISSIYLFVPRATDSHDPVVVTFGRVVAGDSNNVIPEEVILGGTLRTLGGTTRRQTKDHIVQLARGMAEASGAAIEVRYLAGTSAVRNDPDLTNLFRRSGAELLGPESVQEIARPSMGGEDFAHYLDLIPGSMFRLGCASAAKGGVPLHSPEFDLDERALAVGAKILARAVVMACDLPIHSGETPTDG